VLNWPKSFNQSVVDSQGRLINTTPL